MLKKKFIPSPLIADGRQGGQPSKPLRAPRGLFVVWLFLRVVWRMGMMRLAGQDRSRELGRFVRSELERLGGLWVKVGRILATRGKTQRRWFGDELAEIHEDVAGFSGEVAKEIIRSDLRRPANEIFREFDVVPVATTALGQIHVAWLAEKDTKVAIKIQRPGAREAFFRDLAILAHIVAFLRFFSLCSWAKLDALVLDLEKISDLEFDYRAMVQGMQGLRQAIGTKNVYVPKVFPRYSTERVLVMEFIDGVSIADYDRTRKRTPKKARKWCLENEIHPPKLRRRIEALDRFSSAHSSRRFISDKIMMLRKNRIALLDIGLPRTVVQESDGAKFHKLPRNRS
jgi:ubiquinone biosynthesis protein